MSKGRFARGCAVFVSSTIVALGVAAGLLWRAPAARADNSCSLGTTYYSGYEEYSIPPGANPSLGAEITDNGDHLYTDGNPSERSHLAGYVDVQDSSGSHWLKAGIYNDSAHGRILWIDYNTDKTGHVFVQGAAANIGTSYLAVVARASDGTWEASIGGLSRDKIPLSGMTQTRFVGASFTQSAVCNIIDFKFAEAFPWETGQMNAKLQDGVYSVTDAADAYGWTSNGGGDVCRVASGTTDGTTVGADWCWNPGNEIDYLSWSASQANQWNGNCSGGVHPFTQSPYMWQNSASEILDSRWVGDCNALCPGVGDYYPQATVSAPPNAGFSLSPGAFSGWDCEIPMGRPAGGNAARSALRGAARPLSGAPRASPKLQR